MIKVEFHEDLLKIFEDDDTNSSVFKKPLHRMFIRGTLGGVYNDEDKIWEVANNNNIFEIIDEFTNYFNKYDIEFSLDNSLNEIIEKKNKQKEKFNEIKEKGAKLKTESKIENIHGFLELVEKQLSRPLKDHQKKSLQHLITVENGANFSVPGSGKTSVILAYYSFLLRKHKNQKLLVIGPASCFMPWEEEYKECFNDKPKSLRLSGISKKERGEKYLEVQNYNLILTTYHTAANDTQELINILSRGRYLVVLDESHYIKKPGEGKLVNGVLAISKFCNKRVILSGTPMPNDFVDLWSQFTFLWPNNYPLGKLATYQNQIKNTSSDKSSDLIHSKINGLFFRVTKSDLSLGKPNFHPIYCDMNQLQEKIYLGISSKYLTVLELSKDDKDALRQYRTHCVTRLIQVAVNPSLLTKDCLEFDINKMDLEKFALKDAIRNYPSFEVPSKIQKCLELTKEIISSGRKVIIWSTFIHNLKMLDKLLAEYNPVVVYGAVPYSSDDEQEITREKLVNKFKTDIDCKVFIANPAACAEAISLHNICSDAIYLDRSYNCAHYVQSLDRIHRVGLHKDIQVNYHILLSKNTIDEKVSAKLEEKMNRMNDILENKNINFVEGYWEKEGVSEDDLEFIEEHLRDMLNKR